MSVAPKNLWNYSPEQTCSGALRVGYGGSTVVRMIWAQVDLMMTVAYGTRDEATVRLCEGFSRHEDVERQLADLIETRPSRVMLDLSELSRISSAGLGVMLALRRGVVNYAGEVRIASPSAGVADLFRQTGLDVLFEVATNDAAVLTA